MPLPQELLNRWDADRAERPELFDAKVAFLRGKWLHTEAEDNIAKVKADKRYSADGQRELIRKWGSEVGRPEFLYVRERLERADAQLKQARAVLSEIKIDKSDLAAAMLRQELRAMLREMGPNAAMALLARETDPRLLEAVLEAPAPLTGLDPEAIDNLRVRLMEAKHPEKVAEIEADARMVEVATAVVSMTERLLQQSLGIPSAGAWSAFLEAA